jgi:hypothetical protein
MKRVRGGSGLGDSLYIRPICDELMRRGDKVTALSNYPDVFIGSGVKVEPFSRDNIDVIAHYVEGKTNNKTNQWRDVCNRAKIDTEMKFAWAIRNHALIKRIRTEANGRKIIVIHGGRSPMGRRDGFAIDLMPTRDAFLSVIESLHGCLMVGIGSTDDRKYEIPVDIDLADTTSVSDLLDMAYICNGMIAQCSFAVPMAECFDKPLLAIWSARAKSSNQEYIRTITPQKVLSKPGSTFIMDDWDKNKISGVAHAFC